MVDHLVHRLAAESIETKIVSRRHALLKIDDTSAVTVRCSNTTDCTEPLQAALFNPSAAHVIVPYIGRPWNTRPLILNRSS
jgi:hypothetical protein